MNNEIDYDDLDYVVLSSDMEYCKKRSYKPS